MSSLPLARRCYCPGVELSVVGLGGMTLVGLNQASANRLVMDAIEHGVNYFDVAPFYGDGEAERKLGEALVSRRGKLFLSCKTLERSAEGAERELHHSLRELRTDHFDLYQFHAVSTMRDVEEIFAPRGALVRFLKAREEGKIRFIGFSAHSVEAALAMLERFRFDSILFPVNFVCYAREGYGPQVIRRAREQGAAVLAIKAMAHGPWRKGETREYPNCWYRPIDDRDLARSALRFTLSEDVTALVPPGDERLFRLALELVPELTALDEKERAQLLASAAGLRPLLRYRRRSD